MSTPAIMSIPIDQLTKMPPYEGQKTGSPYVKVDDPYRLPTTITPAAPITTQQSPTAIAGQLDVNAFKNLPQQQTTAPTDIKPLDQVTAGTANAAVVGQSNLQAPTAIGLPNAANDSPLVKQYQSMMSKAMSVNEGMLTGAIPEDVKKQIEQTMAEQGLSKGLYGTMTQEATVKALGLTSLDIQQKGVASALEYAKLGESIRQYDTNTSTQIAQFNNSMSADISKYVEGLNANADLSNAQRSDAMNQFLIDTKVKTQEFNKTLDLQRQQANIATQTQVAMANTQIRSETDRTAATNYFNAVNVNMQTKLAYDNLNMQEAANTKALNAKLAFDQRSLDEQKLEWEDKWAAMITDTQFKVGDSNADRVVLLTELRSKMFQYTNDLEYKWAITKAEGNTQNDDWLLKMKAAVESITNLGGLPAT